MYFVYSILMGLAALFTAPYWLIQGMRHGKYFSNLGDRLGFVITATDRLPTDRPGAIWIHAVSVGEALSGVALAKRLKEAYPKRPLVVSTTTQTGHALAKDSKLARTAMRYKINIPQLAAQVRSELSRKDKPVKNGPKPATSALRK